MIRLSALVSAMLVAASSSVHAQSMSALQSGAKVRIHVDRQRTVSGVLLAPMHDSARVSTMDGLRMVALGDIRGISVSRGRESRGKSMLRKGGIGTLAGLLGGVILGIADGDDDPSGWFAMSAGEKAAMGGIVLGAAGFVGGSIVGLASPGERWESVPIR